MVSRQKPASSRAGSRASKRPQRSTGQSQTGKENKGSDDQTASSVPERVNGHCYRKEFKEEVLRQVNSGRMITAVARQYGISERSIRRWHKAAKKAGGSVADPKSTRPHGSALAPINEEHRQLILSLKDKHPTMGPAQIQNQLKRFHAINMSRHMIRRIFSEAGIALRKHAGGSDADRSKNRFEMSRPNELWAVDFTDLWIQSEKAYALFLLDDFSRFCLGFALTKEPTAQIAIDTVGGAIQRYGCPERVLSDRGQQFHAWNGVSRFDKFLDELLVDHTVTKADHPFTNGKIEAFNRSIANELFGVIEFASLKEAEEGIEHYIRQYNFLRTHMGIDGLVPADRYFGLVEEARKALEEGLRKLGPGLSWLKGVVSHDGAALRPPAVLQLVLRDEELELVVLGRRFTLA